jgi:ABC-type multidrug transport system ATPase subunit
LILDEPTSQLDPIAASEFLKTLEKINRELGTTIILTEHRLEDAFPIADRVIVLDGGKIISDEIPEKTEKYEGFHHLISMSGEIELAKLNYEAHSLESIIANNLKGLFGE